jgi:hypothetical protein
VGKGVASTLFTDVIHKKVGRSKCGVRSAEFKTKNRMEHGAKGIAQSVKLKAEC